MNIRSYKVIHGLPQSQVVSLYRHPDGYLWVGTYSGAARYNGRVWTTFGMDEGLPGTHVNAITSDKNGTLWVGTFGQGMARFDGNRFQGFPIGSVEGSCLVTRFTLDQKQRLWASTDLGLLLYDNGFKLYSQEDGLPSLVCRYVYCGTEGLLYVGTDQGLVAMRDGQIERLPFQAAFEGLDVRVIAEDRERRLWVGTSHGLYYVEGRQVIKVEHPVLKDSTIMAAANTDEDGMWFATWRDGAFKLAGGEITQMLTTANGLASNTVHALFFDEEHSLWLGTDSGLSKYRPSAFVSLTAQHGLTNTFARALHLDDKDQVWVGTRNGVFRVDENLVVHPVDTHAFASQVVFAIDRKPDGTLVFVLDSCVTLMKGDHVVNFGENVGLRTTTLRTGLVDHKGQIWVGGDGLMRLDDNRFEKLPEGNALASLRIYDLVEDADGIIWAGTRDGLVRFDPETGKSQIPDGPRVPLWDVALDPKGGLWLGTNGKGLWHYDGKAFEIYDSKNSDLGNDFVWHVLAARNGDVWMGHNQGIDLLREKQFSHFTVADGLVDNEGAATAVVQDRRGRIFFGTSEGITIYIQRTVTQTEQRPRVMVEGVEVSDLDGQTAAVSPGQKLAHKRNNLTFHFAGLSFVKEEDVHFAYQLEGQEQGWNMTANFTEVRYMNLVPGSYVFRVKASNPGGTWSEDRTFAFSVMPAFYQTLWFRLLLGLGVVALILLYVRARLVLVERRNRELEALVAQRTEALAEKGREFRELSLMDPLTRVRNRRYVTELMREELSKLKRSYFHYKPGDGYSCIALVLMDLDHFKNINDSFGHDGGDSILVETAHRLGQVVRQSDVVARWGGEEFLVLVRDISPQDVPNLVQKLVVAIGANPFEIGETRVNCTASAGFACLHPGLVLQDVPWEWALKLADIALYRAKDKGRDRACGVVYDEKAAADAWSKAVEHGPESSIEGGVLKLVLV